MSNEKSTTQEQAARRIAGLLALAEEAAKKGDEALRDNYLEKATALQIKYVVDEAMLPSSAKGPEAIVFEDFCQESNTPLIKAKRLLINAIALTNRGRAVMLGEYRTQKGGKRAGQQVWDRRAKIRVYAHESDLAFIRTLYTSLILQMQTMMAADERTLSAVPNSWRVSYSYGWVARINERLREIASRQEREAETTTPGTALVLRDRSELVGQHFANIFPNARRTSYRLDNANGSGRGAGYRAAGNADLGGTKVTAGQRPQIGR